MKDGWRDAHLAGYVRPHRTPVSGTHLLPDARGRRDAEVGVVRVDGNDLGDSTPDLGSFSDVMRAQTGLATSYFGSDSSMFNQGTTPIYPISHYTSIGKFR